MGWCAWATRRRGLPQPLLALRDSTLRSSTACVVLFFLASSLDRVTADRLNEYRLIIPRPLVYLYGSPRFVSLTDGRATCRLCSTLRDLLKDHSLNGTSVHGHRPPPPKSLLLATSRWASRGWHPRDTVSRQSGSKRGWHVGLVDVKDGGSPHTRADAHGNNAAARAAPPQFMQEGGDLRCQGEQPEQRA